MAPSPGTHRSPSRGSIDDPDLTRLPKNVVPKRYELKLDVHPDKYKYDGLVNIRLYFTGPETSIVWLHGTKFKVLSASIRFTQFSLPVEAVEVITRPKKQCIGIRFAKPIEEGTRAWLSVSFAGSLTQNLEGFFSLPYKNQNGERKLGAATMFAATEARSCFPCFDEPELKAIFALEVTVDNHLQVISNMPVQDVRFDTTKGGVKRRTDYFEWTKEMSTYLVCVVIGEFEYLETKAAGRTTVRVYTPWGQREQGRFAIEVSKKSLEFFNDYFGKRYPLPKLDLVALSRLSVGAMENWGVVTVRETGLITDHEEANPNTLQSIATLIAHEISHQWFGNLVTMKWWDGLYLNEGFATLMQYICIDHLFPEYKVFNRFCSETVIPALGLDSLSNSHPIEMTLTESSEISQVFDKITYCKGASVMFMLHEFIGGPAFKDAIQGYMEHFSYDNATTEDLFRFLSASGKVDVGDIMNTWIRDPGFPLITASLEPYPGENKVMLRLEQERFTEHPKSSLNLLWNIPLKGIYVDRSGALQKFDLLFDKMSTEVPLKNFDLDDPSCFVKLNPGLTGFYRVRYGKRLFNCILKNANSEHLSSTDRLGILDDQVSMVLCSGGSSEQILKTISLYAGFEKSVTVWKAILGVLKQIRTITWSNDEIANNLDQFCLDIVRPQLSRIGLLPLHSESSNDRILRASIFNYHANLADEATVAMSQEMLKSHIDGTAPIPLSIRSPAFRSCMVRGTHETLEQMKMLYRTAETAEERLPVLSAIGAARDPNVLAEVLDYALSDALQPQEALSVFSVAGRSRFGHKLVWSYFVANFDRICERYLGGLFLFSRIVRACTESFTDDESFHEVSEFFARNRSRLVGGEMAFQRSINHIETNITWKKRDLEKVQSFLDSYYNS